MFEINQHVLCVNDMGDSGVKLSKIDKGKVYTIRDIAPGLDFDNHEQIGISLEEVVLPLDKNGKEYMFRSSWFKPLRRLTIDEFLMEEA